MLSLAEMMEPERVRQLIRDYQDENAAQLEHMCECEAADMTAGQRFVFGLGKAVYSAIATYMNHNADALIDALERGDHGGLPGLSNTVNTSTSSRKAGE